MIDLSAAFPPSGPARCSSAAANVAQPVSCNCLTPWVLEGANDSDHGRRPPADAYRETRSDLH